MKLRRDKRGKIYPDREACQRAMKIARKRYKNIELADATIAAILRGDPVKESTLVEFAGEVNVKGKDWVTLAQQEKQEGSNQEILASFAPYFGVHGTDVTDLVDYHNWHTEVSRWVVPGCPSTFWSITYHEFTASRLWTNKDCFVDYEAYLRQLPQGGEAVRRVFVVDRDQLLPEENRLALLRTLLRHERLGFQSKIIWRRKYSCLVDALDPTFDTVAAFSGRAYFMRFPENSNPLMLATIDSSVVRSANEFLERLWVSPSVEPASGLVARLLDGLTDSGKSSVRHQVDIDIDVIENDAFSPPAG